MNHCQNGELLESAPQGYHKYNIIGFTGAIRWARTWQEYILIEPKTVFFGPLHTIFSEMTAQQVFSVQ